MAQIINNKQSVTFSEPMVVLSLREWEETEENIDDLEDAVRYYKALAESKNDKLISLKEVRKKYNLK